MDDVPERVAAGRLGRPVPPRRPRSAPAAISLPGPFTVQVERNFVPTRPRTRRRVRLDRHEGTESRCSHRGTWTGRSSDSRTGRTSRRTWNLDYSYGDCSYHPRRTSFRPVDPGVRGTPPVGPTGSCCRSTRLTYDRDRPPCRTDPCVPKTTERLESPKSLRHVSNRDTTGSSRKISFFIPYTRESKVLCYRRVTLSGSVVESIVEPQVFLGWKGPERRG